MTLSQEDGQLYYRLWLPLLDYVNRKYRVNRKLKSIATAKELDLADVKEAANKMWSDVTIIDDYLKETPDLPDEHREIIQSWKRRVQGKFMMERHLKKGAIFISLENEEVYQVSGIISSWEEMFYGVPMPLIDGSDSYAISGCDHIRWFGDAVQHPCWGRYETNV